VAGPRILRIRSPSKKKICLKRRTLLSIKVLHIPFGVQSKRRKSFALAYVPLTIHALVILSAKNPEPNPIKISLVIYPKNIENTANTIKGNTINKFPS